MLPIYDTIDAPKGRHSLSPRSYQEAIMKDIQMADVEIHIDETLEAPQREKIRAVVLAKNGIMTAVINDNKPHLMFVGYDPDVINSLELLKTVTNEGVHAELIGF